MILFNSALRLTRQYLLINTYGFGNSLLKGKKQ
jgi:hypothetical protein